MSLSNEVEFRWVPSGSSGSGVLSMIHPAGCFTDKLDITKSKDRGRYLDAVVDFCPGLDRSVFADELEEIAKSAASALGGAEVDDGQANMLVALVDQHEVELFHAGEGVEAEGYATFAVGDHAETWSLKSLGFRRWLTSKYFAEHQKAPNEQALKSALGTLEARAAFEGEQLKVCVRVAGDDDTVWVDLGDETWEVVRIDKGGWERVDAKGASVRFTRPSGLLALPSPVRGGSLSDVRSLVNLPSNDDWVLTLGWLVMALHPKGDHPILAVNGEEGTAKTTLCRLLRRLVDPNRGDLRRPFSSEQDLVIAAKNSWVIGLDNLSGLSKKDSDSLCCASTGSALSMRTLFTTAEETLIVIKRPVLINGIPDLATRGDLASRCITLTLESIADKARLTRKEVEKRFECVTPGVLGALYDAVSMALRRQSEVDLGSMSRMADFCVWATAAEPALGLSDGAFMAAYQRRLEEGVDAVIESSPVGCALLELLARQHGAWRGTSTSLLDTLDPNRRGSKRPLGWPDSAQKIASEVRRLAPSLRKKGIDVVFPKRGDNPRLYTIGPLPTAEGAQTRRGEARSSAGAIPSGNPEKGASRASAPPALGTQSSLSDDEPELPASELPVVK